MMFVSKSTRVFFVTTNVHHLKDYQYINVTIPNRVEGTLLSENAAK